MNAILWWLEVEVGWPPRFWPSFFWILYASLILGSGFAFARFLIWPLFRRRRATSGR